MNTPINVGVVGSGTMGSGIAQVAAIHGHEVQLFDIDAAALSRGIAAIDRGLRILEEKGTVDNTEAESVRNRIHPRSVLSDLARTQIVIEAAAETLDVKRAIFLELAGAAPPETILASNTSSLSISSIAAGSPRATNIIGMHFFNPAPVMPLVEIVRGPATSDDTTALALAFCRGLGKTPVVCADTPGFIVNRVARPFYGEALRLLGEGISSFEEIDRIMREAGGFRMGPFELMDLIGIDVNYAVTQSVYEQFFHEPRFRPHPIQRRMVEAGTLGRKSGRGFYTYGAPENRSST